MKNKKHFDEKRRQFIFKASGLLGSVTLGALAFHDTPFAVTKALGFADTPVDHEARDMEFRQYGADHPSHEARKIMEYTDADRLAVFSIPMNGGTELAFYLSAIKQSGSDDLYYYSDKGLKTYTQIKNFEIESDAKIISHFRQELARASQSKRSLISLFQNYHPETFMRMVSLLKTRGYQILVLPAEDIDCSSYLLSLCQNQAGQSEEIYRTVPFAGYQIKQLPISQEHMPLQMDYKTIYTRLYRLLQQEPTLPVSRQAILQEIARLPEHLQSGIYVDNIFRLV